MSEYRTNNSDAMVTTVAPLFASSWLALYYILRENFDARRSSAVLPEHVGLSNDDIAGNTTTD